MLEQKKTTMLAYMFVDNLSIAAKIVDNVFVLFGIFGITRMYLDFY